MINREVFFKSIKSNLIHTLTQSQVDGFNALFDVWDQDYSDKPLSYLAYCLATSYHETAFAMKPVEEWGHGSGHSYSNPAGPYKKRYYGRGFVQLTWYDNYRKANTILNKQFNIDEDLVKSPENALKLNVASLILFQGMIDGWFTGKKLSDYFSDKTSDATNARKIINGLDKAHTIATYFTAFNNSLKLQDNS